MHISTTGWCSEKNGNEQLITAGLTCLSKNQYSWLYYTIDTRRKWHLYWHHMSEGFKLIRRTRKHTAYCNLIQLPFFFATSGDAQLQGCLLPVVLSDLTQFPVRWQQEKNSLGLPFGGIAKVLHTMARQRKVFWLQAHQCRGFSMTGICIVNEYYWILHLWNSSVQQASRFHSVLQPEYLSSLSSLYTATKHVICFTISWAICSCVISIAVFY